MGFRKFSAFSKRNEAVSLLQYDYGTKSAIVFRKALSPLGQGLLPRISSRISRPSWYRSDLFEMPGMSFMTE